MESITSEVLKFGTSLKFHMLIYLGLHINISVISTEFCGLKSLESNKQLLSAKPKRDNPKPKQEDSC